MSGSRLTGRRRGLVPDGSSPPQTHRSGRFAFQPLSVELLGMDWVALNSAIDRVRDQDISIPGFEGLVSPISIEQDFYDVAWHQREFTLGSTLTYAVMAPDGDRCLGSVYMYPASPKAEVDTEIFLWLAEDEFQQAGDDELYETVRQWVSEEFPFLGDVSYPGRDGSPRTVHFEDWAMVAAGFEVPERFVHERFVLAPLEASRVLADFDSWMSNVEHLRRYEIKLPAESTSTWPTYGLSPLDNLVDLGWHYAEFQRRLSFAYSILSPSDECRVLGSVYVFPADAADVDASIPMWVREPEYEAGLDGVVADAVAAWIAADWPFGNVDYPRGRLMPDRDRAG